MKMITNDVGTIDGDESEEEDVPEPDLKAIREISNPGSTTRPRRGEEAR